MPQVPPDLKRAQIMAWVRDTAFKTKPCAAKQDVSAVDVLQQIEAEAYRPMHSYQVSKSERVAAWVREQWNNVTVRRRPR